MTTVYLGVGSNIDRHRNISTGLDVLQERFGLQRASRAYESPAIGFDGPAFLNLVVELETTVELIQLAMELRELEYHMGRPRNASRFSSRTLDLDILTFAELTGTHSGVELPRREILENAFVLAPLAELAPEALHPLVGKTYTQLWEEYDRDSQSLVAVEFNSGGWSLPFS